MNAKRRTDIDIQLRDDRRPRLYGLSAKLLRGQCGCDTSFMRRGNRHVCPDCGRNSEFDEVEETILAEQYERTIPEVFDR